MKKLSNKQEQIIFGMVTNRYGKITKEQNFKGIYLYLFKEYYTLKNKDYNLKYKLMNVYARDLQNVFIKHLKTKLNYLQIREAMRLTILHYKREKVYLSTLKQYLNNVIFEERKRSCYRILSEMWGIFCENYRKLSTSIYQK